MEKKVFNKFREVVYARSGISLGPNKEALVSSRIGKRMRSLGMDEYTQYLNFVLSDDGKDEIVQLIDAISTNVTSFYRESVHFDFLADALKTWQKNGQDRFRIWCAASSTGEEPYTLAITALESLQARSANIKILATDISTKVLKACMKGQYAADKVQTVPPALLKKYFIKQQVDGETLFSAQDTLKRILTVRQLNLAKPPFPMKGPLDVVFCRNVMIYFDNGVREKLLNEAHRLLKPGGYLIVGHAESLTGLLSCFKSVKPSIYVKTS